MLTLADVLLMFVGTDTDIGTVIGIGTLLIRVRCIALKVTDYYHGSNLKREGRETGIQTRVSVHYRL